MLVSILVLLDMALMQAQATYRRGINPVSILVLLDMALMLHLNLHRRGGLYCFNPCFTGYGSDAKALLDSEEMSAMFQSLFYWIWL